MERNKLIEKAYDRSAKLSMKESDYIDEVRIFTSRSMENDVRKADITTESVLKEDEVLRAVIKAKEDGIISGLDEVLWFYNENNIRARTPFSSGDRIKEGNVLIELEGHESELLKTERSGLNILQRMSGIATMTNRLSEKADPTVIVGTRKTHWGLLDNKAITDGGGMSHRLGLWEAILIKENHLEAIKAEGDDDAIPEALRRAWMRRKDAAFIEIEVKDIKEAMHAARSFQSLGNDDDCPRIIMLDNFTPEDVKSAIAQMKSAGVYRNIITEASGMINENNIDEYRQAGVDVVSVGCLTHSPKAFDMSQLILRD